MISMKQTPLDQLASVSAGQGAPKDNEFSDSGIPFVRAGSLDSLLSGKNESELELVRDETAKLRKLKIYPKGTILFAKSGMSATKDRIYVLQNPAYVVSHLATLIPNDSAHADYLRLALKNFPPSVLIKDPAYPAISLGDIQSYEIPVPDQLDDQIRIAHLLGKVEGLIAQRKQHLQQLDDLLKSVFLEMFGDPMRNEKKWITHPFSSLFSLHPRIGTTTPVSNDGTIPVIRVGELGEFQVKFSNCKKVNLEKKEMDKCRVTKGDILLARAIASQGHLGKASLITHLEQDTAFDSHVMRIRFKAELTAPEFAYHWLKSSGGRTLFLKASGRTSVQFNINSKQISSITMPLPPIDLQNQFAVIVEKVEGIKSRYQQSLSDLETLYGALSQQAFKGKLDLSRVPLPSTKPEEEKAVATVPLQARAEESLAINLPDTDNLLDALENTEAREALIAQWLEAYRGQLGDAAFSVEPFMAAAQTRLAELHPDDDFELDANDYEHIKTWVFEALTAGKLAQALDDAGNRIQLKAVQA